MKDKTMLPSYAQVAKKNSTTEGAKLQMLKRSIHLPDPKTPPLSPTDKQLVDALNDFKTNSRPLFQAQIQPQATPPLTPNQTLCGFKDPCFPDIHHNDFRILEVRQLNPMLSIAYCGVVRGKSQRLWSFCIGTPNCLVEKIFSKQDMGTTHDRFILTPDYTNEVHGSDFTTFMDCIEAVSEKVRRTLEERGEDVSQWKSPCRALNGVVEGLQVKVRMANIAQDATKIKGSCKAVIKLSCVYFAPERSGLSFELLRTVPVDPTIQDPPEDWNVATPMTWHPLETMDAEDSLRLT
jgi:hypothetical protein